NGQPEAILYDNGYLTDVRTAAAGGVAAKYMANENVEIVGVIGAGAQAEYQLEALKQIREIKHVHVFSKTIERLQEYKKKIENELKIPVTIMENAESVVRQSDLLITTTPATEPLIQYDWIPAGMHITAMGSDAEHKQELSPDIIQQADVVVCDVIRQCELLGELSSTLEEELIPNTRKIKELGVISSQKKPVRKRIEDITVEHLTGTGAQDT